MRFQPATAQSFISPAAFKTRRSEWNKYLGLSCFLAGHFDRLDNDFTNLLSNARSDRLSLRRGVGSVLDEFGVLLDKNDIPEDDSVPSSTGLFLIVFNNLHCCLSFCTTSCFFAFLGTALPFYLNSLTHFSSIEQDVPLFPLKVSHLRHSSSGRCSVIC